MTVQVRYFASFREAIGEKETEESAENIRDLLHSLAEKYEPLKDELFEDEDGEKLKNHVNLLVNGNQIRTLEGLDTELEDGDTVSIYPPVAGG